MNFKVGQKVELVDNSFMDAERGAIAIVTRATYDFVGVLCIDVQWMSNSNSQVNGCYKAISFIPHNVKGEQFLFNFME